MVLQYVRNLKGIKQLSIDWAHKQMFKDDQLLVDMEVQIEEMYNKE
jgi:hypothetical protein